MEAFSFTVCGPILDNLKARAEERGISVEDMGRMTLSAGDFLYEHTEAGCEVLLRTDEYEQVVYMPGSKPMQNEPPQQRPTLRLVR